MVGEVSAAVHAAVQTVTLGRQVGLECLHHLDMEARVTSGNGWSQELQVTPGNGWSQELQVTPGNGRSPQSQGAHTHSRHKMPLLH